MKPLSTKAQTDAWFNVPDAGDNRLQQEQEDNDLRAVLNSPEGERFILRLLHGWNATGRVACDERSMTLRNEAEDLLADIARTHPAACLRIMATLRGITAQ